MSRLKDLTGQRFGRLVVIERAENIGRQVAWVCKCDCGNTCTIMGSSLKRGSTKSCGCLQKDLLSERMKIDLTGQRFGRLTVIQDYGRDKHGNVRWLCECECGNTCVVESERLQNGATKSCGCLMKELSKERMSRTVKELWKDEDYRQMKTDGINKQWSDEEFRNKMSGENHYNYKPELTDEDREDRRLLKGYSDWCKQIKEQADYTCDCCGERGGDLHSHHLDGYNWCRERRVDLTNGVCLCDKCHKEFHHIYGQGNNTEQQYIEFKENKQKELSK